MNKLDIIDKRSPLIIGDSKSLFDEDINQNQQELMKEIIKYHFDIITLSMLSEKPMSGHDILRNIFLKYNVLLSQGTIYSLLSSLKEEGKIKTLTNKGDLRTKKYICTEEKISEIQKNLFDFIDTMEYFLESIKKELYVKKLPDRFR